MNALKQHAEKLVFVVVLLACAGLLLSNSLQSDAQTLEQLRTDKEAIQNALALKNVTANYRFSTNAAAKLDKSRQDYQTSVARPAAEPAPYQTFAIYPRPSRPAVDPTTEPKPLDALIKNVNATLGEPADVQARGDHGHIFVSYKLPPMELMEAVRVEVFRGLAADKIDMKTPYGVQEFAPEELPPPAPAAPTNPTTPAKNVAPALKADDNLSTGARRMRDHERMPTEPKAGTEKLAAAAPVNVPPELQGVRIFADTRVDAKRAYFYQLRLVGRMTVAPNSRVEVKDASGKITNILVQHPPVDAVSIPTKTGVSNLLYVSAPTKAVSAIPPSNFEIRFAGTDESAGPVPPLGTPDWKLRDYTGYKGNFAVRVWLQDAQKWEETTLRAGPSEPLKGKIVYKLAGSPDLKVYDFDSEFTLLEIKKVEEHHMVKKKVAKMDEKGQIVLDELRRPVMEEKEVAGQTFVNDVAVVKHGPSGKVEEYPKRSDFPAREKYIEIYRKMAETQAAELKAQAEKDRAIRERLQQRQQAQPQPVQPGQNPNTPQPNMPPNLPPNMPPPPADPNYPGANLPPPPPGYDR